MFRIFVKVWVLVRGGNMSNLKSAIFGLAVGDAYKRLSVAVFSYCSCINYQ